MDTEIQSGFLCLFAPFDVSPTRNHFSWQCKDESESKPIFWELLYLQFLQDWTKWPKFSKKKCSFFTSSLHVWHSLSSGLVYGSSYLLGVEMNDMVSFRVPKLISRISPLLWYHLGYDVRTLPTQPLYIIHYISHDIKNITILLLFVVFFRG